VVFVIASLSFAFGFGNGWQLGLTLGVADWIAPLVAPAVDLSVVALLTTLHYLRAQGVGGRLAGPRLLLAFCGLMTFGLNTARAITTGQPGRACFDAIAPLLLIGWSEVGPRLLALLHQPMPQPADGVQDEVPSSQDRPGPSPELLAEAQRLDQEHRQAFGRPITRDKLRAALKVSNATAGEVLRGVRQTAVSPETGSRQSAL
jgi:hypothetical protein